VTLNTVAGTAWRGRLRELSPSADPVTRSYAARIAIRDPAPGIELGMSARVAIEAAAGAGVELPPNALRSRGEASDVWVVGADGAVHAVPVKLVATSRERVVVESALKAGDRVVIAGAPLLREGQKVRVLPDELRR
jgi:RND family efflux transporter MFP subunit